MKRYVYDYYLADLLVCDKNSVLTKINTLSEVSKNIVELHQEHLDTLIALGVVSSKEKVDGWLEEVRQTLIEYNKILDEYNVNVEMRFDVDDLPSAIRFHRTLFYYLYEDDWKKAIQANRKRFLKKQ